jgi:uncharacterized protein (DUF2249 family)
MKIDKNTRISALIKANKDSIDAIASLSGPLEKLKNPVLRKLMASRVTIAEAAKMGNCNIADFERVLTPLGFEFEETAISQADQPEDQTPEWLKALPPGKITFFDVREMLAAGNDPLKEIMKRFKATEQGKALCIINTFVPTPLVRLFEKDGTLCYTDSISEKEYHTYFFKQERKKEPPQEKRQPNLTMEKDGEFQKLKQQFAEKGITEIDVRHLEMPGPMQAILAALETLPSGKALLVHHKRVPVYLLEELEDKDFIIHIFNVSETDVKLLIEKN